MAAVLEASSAGKAKTGSMRRDRKRALYWSYFFLVLFVM